MDTLSSKSLISVALATVAECTQLDLDIQQTAMLASSSLAASAATTLLPANNKHQYAKNGMHAKLIRK